MENSTPVLFQAIFIHIIYPMDIFSLCKVLPNTTTQLSIFTYQRWVWHISISNPNPSSLNLLIDVIIYHLICQQFV